MTRGSGAEFFLHIYLVTNNIDPSAVRVVDIAPDRIIAALLEGEVDAVSTWSPYKNALLEQLGDDAVLFTDPWLYLQTFNLMTRKDLLKQKPDTLGKLLRGIIRANNFIGMHPEEAQTIISRHTGVESAEFRKQWSDYSFMAVLDQSLILNLEDKARWLLKQSAAQPTEAPNFIELMGVEPLRKVRPEAVRIFGR